LEIYLGADETAAVLTYVRNTFGNKGFCISADEIQGSPVRKSRINKAFTSRRNFKRTSNGVI